MIFYESKQVGNIYHVCTLKSINRYIAPTDTLTGSPKFFNKITKNNGSVVYFTRQKNFIPTFLIDDYLIFSLEVDGNKLSENYKIIPYNDNAYSDYDSKWLMHEEIVLGAIHPVSKYIKNILFNVFVDDISDVQDLRRELELFLNETTFEYLNEFNIKFTPNLINLGGKRSKCNFSSFNDFVDSVFTVSDFFLNNKINKKTYSQIIKNNPEISNALKQFGLLEVKYFM